MRSLAMLLGTIAAHGQTFSVGFKAGVPATELIDAEPGAKSAYGGGVTNRYLVGPTVEVRLPWGLSLEADAIYRHFRYASSGGFPGYGFSYSRVAGHAWEFPLLAKYRLGKGVARPYMDAGIGWDAVAGKSTSTGVLVPPYGSGTTTTSTSGLGAENDVATGIIAGGGLDIHTGILHISPEIRYTRWVSQHFAQFGGGEYGTLASNQNQLEFLVGFTF